MKTELVSFFMALLSRNVKFYLSYIPGTIIREFPWDFEELNTLFSMRALSSEKVSVVVKLWEEAYRGCSKWKKQRGFFIEYYLELQLLICQQDRESDYARETAREIIPLLRNYRYDSHQERRLLAKTGMMEFLGHIPESQENYEAHMRMKLRTEDETDLVYLFDMQDYLDGYISPFTEDRALDFYLSIARMGFFQLIDKINYSRDLRKDYRFLSGLVGSDKTERVFGYIRQLGVDINDGSGMLLRSCCKYFASSGRRASFIRLMQFPTLLINLKTKSNPRHSFLYLLDKHSMEDLISTGTIELFIQKDLVLSQKERIEALNLIETLQYSFFGIETERETLASYRTEEPGMSEEDITATKQRWTDMLMEL